MATVLPKEDAPVSRGISPIIPSFRCYDIRHVCCREDYSGIGSPSSSKPHSSTPNDATIHKGKPTFVIHRLSPLSSDRPTNLILLCFCYTVYATILHVSLSQLNSS
ncbi:hypothetical protein V8G54_021695 [Vigna mungo]|uniref:Uncharacterized protein n=1 Tax=Vigna mungo TaxID=3915 RepID=A0AAQ3RUI4_VIGMU